MQLGEVKGEFTSPSRAFKSPHTALLKANLSNISRFTILSWDEREDRSQKIDPGIAYRSGISP